jgi:hypothetical protein
MFIILYRDITQGETIFAAYRTAGVVKTPKKKASAKRSRRRSRRKSDASSNDKEDDAGESSHDDDVLSDDEVDAKLTIAHAVGDDDEDASQSSADASVIGTSPSNQSVHSRKRGHSGSTDTAPKRVKTGSKLFEVAFGNGPEAPAVLPEPTTSAKTSAKPAPPGRVLRSRKAAKQKKSKKSDKPPKPSNTGGKGKKRGRNSEQDRDDSDTDMATPTI